MTPFFSECESLLRQTQGKRLVIAGGVHGLFICNMKGIFELDGAQNARHLLPSLLK